MEYKTLAEVFDKDFISRLSGFSPAIKTRFTSGFEGNRRAKGKGSSNEFSDYRSYTPGDDPRRIDWNNYARSGKLFIKLFTEEKRAQLNIFLDTSKSMAFGEPEKLFFSKIIAASVAFIALKGSDSVNLFTFSSSLRVAKDNLTGKDRFGEVLSFLDGIRAEGGTDISRTIEDSRAFPIRSGLSVIISDFFDYGGDLFKAMDFLRMKNQEVTLVQIISPEEEDPSLGLGYGERFRLIDSETGSFSDTVCDGDFLRSYSAALERMKENLRGEAIKRAMKYVCAASTRNIFDVLNIII